MKRKSKSKDPVQEEQFSSQNIVEDGTIEETKRKSSEEDKRRKREKNKLKRLKKKEKKLNAKPNEEAVAVSRNEALTYIKTWKEDNESWKFRKKTQTWLIKNMYSDKQVQNADFEILLEYLVGLKGEARNRIIKEAEAIIENSEESTTGASKINCERSRQVIQMLG